MINQNNAQQLAQHLREYLAVAEFLRVNDLANKLDMSEWQDYNFECGTVFCMAGWHTELTHKSNPDPEKHEDNFMDGCNSRVSELASTYEGTYIPRPLILGDRTPSRKFTSMLYGSYQGRGPETLDKLVKRATYLLFRCERMIEEAANARRPRRLRQDHSHLPFPEVAA